MWDFCQEGLATNKEKSVGVFKSTENFAYWPNQLWFKKFSRIIGSVTREFLNNGYNDKISSSNCCHSY